MSESYPPNTPSYQSPYPQTSPPRSGMALAALVLGILGLLCLPLGIVALILGILALVGISKNPLQRSGRGFAISGIVLGGLSVVMLPIVALLVAILLPSLGKARELANRSVCAANLRGMAQSMNVYAADNMDAYPIRAAVGGYGLAGSPSPNITENMYILVSTGQVAPAQFLCKSDPAAVTATPAGGTDFASDMNYSYSFAYPWMATPPRPAGRGSVPGNIGPWWRNQTDASLPLISDMAPLVGTGSPAATPHTPTSKLANSFSHQRDGQNVAFGDAHSEFSRMPNVGQNGDNIFTSNGGTPSATGTAFPGGVVPGIGTGGSAGAFDICVVPAADGSAGYVRR